MKHFSCVSDFYKSALCSFGRTELRVGGFDVRMDHIPRVSEALYVGMCRKIGTRTEVTVRRNVLDMKEEIEKPVEIYGGIRNMMSGSYREGFRLRSSDRDVMIWPTDHKVICDHSQSMFYHPPRDTLIFMDTTDTPHGFATLQLQTPSRREEMSFSVINHNNSDYISSSLYRGYWHQLACGLNNQSLERQMMHGPCHTFSYSGSDVDFAHSLECCHWPLNASSWISRCLTYTWPSRSVLQTIASEGCHLVPIGSKLFTNQENLEWRISFSQAEKNLVYSMNHVQFVCYGLLKITLKEILRDELLCSYFMKTILFWKIQENDSMIWTPYTLLQHFWICYKFLLHCVYTENLPNFFIPENNMIVGKVVGSNRMALLQKLGKFYELGFAFLLHSSSIREILVPALSDPLFVVNTCESNIKMEVDLDITHRKETGNLILCLDNFHENMICLNTVDRLLNGYQNFILQNALVNILLLIASTLKKNACSSPKTNKQFYNIDKSIISMLLVVSKIGFLSDILHLALYLYDSGRYSWALTVTENARQKLSEPHVLYNSHADRQRYSEAMGGQSLLTKMRKAWAKDIVFRNFSYIDELKLEQQVRSMNGISSLFLSPFVMIHMLSVLCHYRLGNRYRYLQSLTDLHTLLLYDEGRYVPSHTRDISWQILGICQHVVGDLQGALQSYQESLRQIQWHKIQKATETRMHLVCEQLGFQ